MRAFGVLAALLVKVLQIAARSSILPIAIDTGLPPRDLGQRDDQVAEHRERRRRTAGECAAPPGREPYAPTANWPRPPAAGRRASSGNVVVAWPGCDVLERLHHALADAARRHVDHPPQADVVVRIDDEPHVGQRVLDFLALVEPDAADDLVGDALAHQRVFNRPRLRVGAIQHRHGRLDVVGQRAAGGTGDEVGLLELVAAAEVCDARAALAVGPQMLVLAVAVLADDGRRRVENDLRRTIVAFELDRRRFRKIVLEVEDVPQVGAAPLVDRLIRDRRRRTRLRWISASRRISRYCGRFVSWYSSTMTNRNCVGVLRADCSRSARTTRRS